MSKKSTTEEFIQKAKKVHGDNYNYSLVEYKSIHDKVQIICKEHGVFEQSPSNHLRGSHCPRCAGGGRIFTADEFLSEAKEVHGNKYDYTLVEYRGTHTKVKIICPIHGMFLQKPNSHTSGRCGCPKCKSSKGEIAIREYLQNKHINFIEQKRFNDCKNKIALPFDFWLPEHNTLIEFDGAQHFIPHTFGGDKDIKTKQKTLERVQYHDSIKTNYCKAKGIHLIRIPYTQLNIIDIILNHHFLEDDLTTCSPPSISPRS